MTRKLASIEPWKIEEVRRYLQERFAEDEIDHFPRGDQAAYLFLVMKRDQQKKSRVTHQLLVTKKFFDRFTNHMALAGALSVGGVVMRMIEASDRTVELH